MALQRTTPDLFCSSDMAPGQLAISSYAYGFLLTVAHEEDHDNDTTDNN